MGVGEKTGKVGGRGVGRGWGRAGKGGKAADSSLK
jgi:hypothetical protein